MHGTVIEGYRLSPQQRFRWSLQEGSALLARCAVHLEGELDAPSLRRALQTAVDRHEILRTSFHRRPGMKVPLQVILDAGSVAWSEVDLRSSGAAACEARLGELFAAAGDLEAGAGLEATLARVGEREHALILRLSSLLADERSLRNLVHEVAEAYAGVVSTDEVVQYVGFSEWQNELVKEGSAEAGEHWREEASAAPLRLSYEAAGAGLPGRVATSELAIEQPAAERLRAAAAESGATLQAAVLAAWKILLWRLGGEPETLSTGVLVDGRKIKDLQGALGPFAKTVPVRTRLAAGLRFLDVVRRVDTALSTAHRWQDYFLEEQSGAPAKGPADLPIHFAWEERPGPTAARGLRISLHRLRVDGARWKLKLSCIDTPGGPLRLQLDADSRVLDEEGTGCLAEQLGALLRSAAAEPRRDVKELELASPAERERLVVRFNETHSALPAAASVQELFERQAAARPGEIAVVCADGEATYGELNVRSNQIAWFLRGSLPGLAAGADVPIALCLDRSLDLVAALLGVLKAGGAYLPLEPSLPPERLRFLLDDARVPVVLTQERWRDRLPETAAKVVCLDRDAALFAAAPHGDLPSGSSPESLAYVLYTSGSTGQPKGVAVEHRQLLNYIHGIAARLDLPPGAIFAMVSTFGADLGNTVLFPSLCGGGRLHVIAQEHAADGEALAEYFHSHPADCLKIVPSHLAALLGSRRAAALVPRRVLVLGGEASSWELVERVEALSGCRILNHYGPTETTVGVLSGPLTARSSPRRTLLPLGTPLANSRIYVLDPGLEPVSTGLTGELFIGGEGLSRGYLRRPDLTAERFVPDPLGAEPGGRLYRTGDLARFQPGGSLEFLGRADHQVKIRGFRVELQEIEAALEACPGVRQAAAVMRQEGASPRLVAYFIPDRPGTVIGEDLGALLRGRLPDHMVPSTFVSLEAFPLTPNGKLDRQSLPDPEQSLRDGEGRSPRSLGEEMLAGIWAEVLGQERVPVDRSFFDLGGHSLLATQLISRVHKVFQVDLSLRSLFEEPTVMGLAARIEAALTAGRRSTQPPIERVPRSGDLPLSFAQERLWFAHQLDPESPAYNLPRALRLIGDLDLTALARALDEVVRRHEALRTTFPSIGGKACQLIAPPQPLALPFVDVAGLPEREREAEVRSLATAAARRPFDLEHGPLLRVCVLRLGRLEHVVLFTLHHIVSDAWSMGVLVREVTALYSAFVAGRESPLPELPIQYADFAAWQRLWLKGDVLEAELAYWRQQLGGAPEELALPRDHPSPVQPTFRGANHLFLLPPEVAGVLRELCRAEGVTLFMALLGAFQVLLHQITGQDDVVVGTDIANRNHLEIEGLIGFFVNNLVMRTRLAGNPSFTEVLARVREVTLGAYAHQDLPFDRLVKALRLRDPSRQQPLFQALFVLQNAPIGPVQSPGLEIRPVDFDFETSKFDLALFTWETRQGIVGSWVYKTDLFVAGTVAAWSRSFETLLRAVAARPALPLDEMDSLGGEEEARGAEERRQRQESKLQALKTGRRPPAEPAPPAAD
jgi:amino acid adenylation domain-containing protein